MNLLDGLLIVLVLVGVVRGYRRGALVQVSSLAGIVLGLVLGAALAPDLARRLVGQPGLGLAMATMGLLLVGLLAGQALGVMAGVRLRRAAADRGAGAGLDQVVGSAVGVATMIALVWLLAGMLAQGPWTPVAQQIQASRIVTEVDRALPPPPDLLGRVSAYLDRQGLPQAVAGLGGPIAPPVDGPLDSEVAAAAEAGEASTVRIRTDGCDATSLGSGFVAEEGFVVTNAHVIAGADAIRVDAVTGTREAQTVHVDPETDLAVLRAPGLDAPALPWVDGAVERGVRGATLGFPGGAEEMVVKPAAVRGIGPAVGRDIYGRGQVTRHVLTVSAGVERGDSGGPFVTADGRVAGVVFASSAADESMGYALAAESVRDVVADAIAADVAADTGACRF